MLDGVINAITNFGKDVGSFFSSLGSIISGLISIIKTLFYGCTTLIGKVSVLLSDIIDGGVFTNVGRAFSQISDYIGGPATVLFATLFLLVIVRIGVAFVFKILRLNIDYHTNRSKTEKASIDDWRRSLKHLE